MNKKQLKSTNLSRYYVPLSFLFALIAYALSILQQLTVDFSSDPTNQSSLHLWYISAALVAVISFTLGLLALRDTQRIKPLILTALIISGFVAMLSISAEVTYLKVLHEQNKIMQQYSPDDI